MVGTRGPLTRVESVTPSLRDPWGCGRDRAGKPGIALGPGGTDSAPQSSLLAFLAHSGMTPWLSP